jgi:hypothetical protein
VERKITKLEFQKKFKLFFRKDSGIEKLSLALTEFKVFVRFSVTLFCFPSFYEVLWNFKFLAVWIPIFFSLRDDFSIKDFKRSFP